jgi:hypothetical protein
MADGIAVVTLVAEKNGRVRHLQQQQGSCRAISDLTAGEQESERSALTVGEGMDLGGSSASGSAYGLIFLPPLPPEAQRCALTAKLSIRTSAGIQYCSIDYQAMLRKHDFLISMSGKGNRLCDFMIRLCATIWRLRSVRYWWRRRV